MNALLAAVINEALGKHAPEPQINMRPPLSIQSNRLYDVWVNDRHLIAKEFLKPDEIIDAPAREYAALQTLISHDIAPRPVFFDSNLAPVVIYEYMPGEMWDRCRPTPADLTQLADVWIRMHSIGGDYPHFSRSRRRTLQAALTEFRKSFKRYHEWSGETFPEAQPAAEMCLRTLDKFRPLAQTLDAEAPPLCLCRTDARFANIIARSDGRLGMVDWEDAGLDDPARDLADLILHANQEDLLAFMDWQPFIRRYHALRTIPDPTFDERLHAHLGIIALFWLAILVGVGVKRAQSGRLEGWQINGLSANLRLQRYLTRAQSWPDLDSDFSAVAQFPFFPSFS